MSAGSMICVSSTGGWPSRGVGAHRQVDWNDQTSSATLNRKGDDQMSVDVSTTIGDLVTADPRRSRVLETYGVDYCCNGCRSLAEATDYAGRNLDEVATALDIPDPAPAQQWAHRENAALAHDIVDTHHAYLLGDAAATRASREGRRRARRPAP
jgi:hypothetical protein